MTTSAARRSLLHAFTLALAIGHLGLVSIAFAQTAKDDQSGRDDDYNQWKLSLGSGPANDPKTFTVQDGFRVDLVRSAGKDEGSWIALTFDAKGRAIVSREDQGLLRLTWDENEKDRGPPTNVRIESINETLLECRGLLWAFDALYVNANNSKGFYRLRDTDGDDQFDDVQLLRSTAGGVGHGRNDLTLGPDGHIYLIHGDDVRLPADFDPASSPLRRYDDPRLFPCSWDQNLFNAAMILPAGHVVRTDRDGKKWELLAGGLRNPYGLDFNAEGELFTFDADMEWDVGMPWYRPTRILHLVSGGDYGWRHGTGPWPAWFPDSVGSTLDVGLGSPTAVRFGTKTNFPGAWKDVLFAADWSYGRILAIHLQPQGASYSAQATPFVTGRPLNLTDLEVGPDGSLDWNPDERDLDRGKQLFAATACSKCHRLDGAGVPVGPDLLEVGRRFGRRDILLSILHPSRVIDEKYQMLRVTTTDGRVLTGQRIGGSDQQIVLAPNPLEPDKTIRVAKENIESQQPSLLSPMPAGLLDTLSKSEILDLLAYLERASGGTRTEQDAGGVGKGGR